MVGPPPPAPTTRFSADRFWWWDGAEWKPALSPDGLLAMDGQRLGAGEPGGWGVVAAARLPGSRSG